MGSGRLSRTVTVAQPKMAPFPRKFSFVQFRYAGRVAGVIGGPDLLSESHGGPAPASQRESESERNEAHGVMARAEFSGVGKSGARNALHAEGARGQRQGSAAPP